MSEQMERKKQDPAQEKRGLECRRCGCRHFCVVHTRERIGGIRRKRQCRNCGKAMWTMEGLPAS